jgi:hypothetical protein
VIQDYPILKYYLIYQHLLMLLFNPLSGNAPKFIILLCLTPDYFTLSNARRFYWVFRRRRPTKTKTYENEDQRPKMGLRNYENEDPLRKRRPIFVFILRKRRATTKTKTHLCFRTTKTKTIKYSFIRYFRENKRKSVAKNFR